MGATAAERWHEDGQTPPRVRLVRHASRSRAAHTAGGAKRARTADLAACRRGFHLACAVIVATCAIGMVRVELSVRAAETALATHALRDDINEERLRNESLEGRRLVLESPGRIESIAAVSMGMSVPENVTYIDVPAHQQPKAASDLERHADGRAGVGDAVSSVLASMIRVTAGTAQGLIAGDAGLAPSR